MTIEDRTEIYNKALDVFGIKNQTLMLAEEQGELFKACNKMVRFSEQFDHTDESDRMTEFRLQENIIEELADNLIMIEQIALFYHVTDKQISEVMDYKVGRLDRLVEGTRKVTQK